MECAELDVGWYIWPGAPTSTIEFCDYYRSSRRQSLPHRDATGTGTTTTIVRNGNYSLASDSTCSISGYRFSSRRHPFCELGSP